MKLQEHNNKLETNVENETQNFGIGDASVVIEILRNRLYEHKVRTLVQEYICNARDAMRESGKGNEFEVTVPTRLNPVFKVRDLGPGISPDRMRDVFVMYGSSTKRGTNNQTGGFGIGAKSAWSYTDSFTIVSIVDGTRRTYVAHTGVNNNGRLDLVATDKTDESNGTEIQVAVKSNDIEEFRSAIFRAIYFWEVKPVLKGELNPPTLVKGQVISNLLEVIDDGFLPEYVREHENSMAVIDGVAYSVHHKLLSKIPSLIKLTEMSKGLVILHFGNGLVEVSASREAIADSPNTINNLEKLAKKALMEAKTYISDAFGKVKSTHEFFTTFTSICPHFNVDGFAKYGDYSVNSLRVSNPIFSKVKLTSVHCLGKYGRGRVEKITKDEWTSNRIQLDIERLKDLFFVVTNENKIVQNKRIREYFKTHTQMILVEQLNTQLPTLDDKGQPILDKDGKQTYHPVSYPAEFKQIIADLGAKDFTSITYIDPPKVKREKIVREKANIGLKMAGSGYNYTTLEKNTQKWIYVRLDHGSWPRPLSDLIALHEYTNNLENNPMNVCGVGKETAKLIENDSNFIELKEYLANFKATKPFISRIKQNISKNAYLAEYLTGIKDIKDQFIVDMIEEYRESKSGRYFSVPDLLLKKVVDDQEIKDFKEADIKFGKLIKEEYPLVEDLQYSKNRKEIAFYINAKYSQRKGK